MLFLCFLLVAAFPSGILGQTEWGFKSYTKYETGNMSLIITVPHGGSEEPTKQENGDKWPKRTHGCLESNECVWEHDCGTPDNKRCRARTLLASPQTCHEPQRTSAGRLGHFPIHTPSELLVTLQMASIPSQVGVIYIWKN